MEKASLPGDSTPQVPLVRYGRFVKHIPGDKYGKKTPHSGNVFHFDDPVRVQNFPTFTEADFALQDDGAEDRINTLKALLQQVGPLLEKGQLMALDQLSDTAIIRDNEEEEVIDFDYKSFACRVAHLKDVQYRDRHSYYRSSRARRVEANSVKKIDAIESSMDRAVENFLVAQTISQGKAPRIPQFRATAKRPNGGDNTQKWYKQMRVEATRSFWLDHEKAERDNIRRAALTPADDIRDIITSVEREDNSRSQDPFYQHHKDTAAASDSDTYELIEKDIFIVLDSGFNYILCSVSQTFQKVFGEAKLDKVTDAIRTWVDMAPLPQPETARHMVDVLMRRKHPDLDMEKATTSDELRARAMCVAHYGTWAMKGHTNPALVFLTDDTLLRMHPSAKARVNLTGEVFPQFKKGVLGLTSDVARVVLQSIAPAEYQECQEAFKALQPTKRMAVSRPNWATLFVLGFNPFTQRHRDTNDVKFGLVSLVPFGDYKGGEMFFPQLGVRLRYQPGDCLVFRGAELEHFVGDWTGNRIFVACTNHQPVRNYALRRLKKLPALPSDPWYHNNQGKTGEQRDDLDEADEGEDEEEEEIADGGNQEEDTYDPCADESLDEERPSDPETGWTDADIHGPATWTAGKGPFDSTTEPSSSSASRGSSESKEQRQLQQQQQQGKRESSPGGASAGPSCSSTALSSKKQKID